MEANQPEEEPRSDDQQCHVVPRPSATLCLVGCPYNVSHQLRPDRLVICRKETLSSPTSPGYRRALGIKIYPYNSAHHIGGSLGPPPSGAGSSHLTGRAMAPPPAARGQEGAQAAQDEVLGETAGRGGVTAGRG